MKQLLLTLSLLLSFNGFTQTEMIEIDSITGIPNKQIPYNKAFILKIPIENENVHEIYLIKRYRNRDLNNTIRHKINWTKINIFDANRSYIPTIIPPNYYKVNKNGDKSYLIISIDDKFKFEPSASYFIVYTLKSLDESALSFFDNYYISQYGPAADRAVGLADARQALAEFTINMQRIFGSIEFGYYTIREFNTNPGNFKIDFDANVLANYRNFYTASSLYNTNLTTNTTTVIASFPNFDSLTYYQLYYDSSINRNALLYLQGKEVSNNDRVSDINSVRIQNRILNILNGSISLECIFCNPVNTTNTQYKDIINRISNIDASIKNLNQLIRSMYLMHNKESEALEITTSINNLLVWVNFLQISKRELKGLLKLRKEIESRIVENIFANKSFKYSYVISGNSYLNFETRNKALLTPDIGMVTSSFNSMGKDLEYGIVPYLGFHMNFMAVDKDISFKSYRKNWKQYCSLMIGWSLVSMNQTNKYENFFEKSSLLTGFGLRLNNTVRLTGGYQWLFKLGTDAFGNSTKTLLTIPFVGLSFDVNVKQYINGFGDIISGIGKTKIASSEK